MKNKLALIFGISGQDGSYLADFLLKKRYKVVGITRDKSKKNLFRLTKLKIINKVQIFKSKQVNYQSIVNILKKFKNVNEIYYLSGETSPLNSLNYPLHRESLRES